MESPKVINCRVAVLRKNGFASLNDWLRSNPSHVYVGRDMTIYVEGAVESKWHNPFKSKKYNNDVECVLQKFKAYIRNGP